MSIDWLNDLLREVEVGKTIFACPNVGRGQWAVAYEMTDLHSIAKKAADFKKLPVQIVRVIAPHDCVAGDLFLCPTDIGEPGVRGEPNIKWSTVDTKEAAEMMRDVRHGPSPFFGIQIEEVVEPKSA
jgi:hypothetical protein